VRDDIASLPLPDEPWAMGKSGGKARTYMAAGVATVCAGVGYNIELIEHGRTGFLCRSIDDWVAALRRLILDPALREVMTEAARTEVAERFSPRVISARLCDLLVEVAAKVPVTDEGRTCTPTR